MRLFTSTVGAARLRQVLVACIFTVMALGAVPASAKTVTDMAGREVVLPENIERILLGEGRLFYALALLEGKEDPFARIVGWQGDFRELDPQSYGKYREKFPHVDRIPLIGKTNENTISAERVLDLRPDIAIFSMGGGHSPQAGNPLVEQLEKMGVPVIFVDFRLDPVGNSVPSLRLLGQAIQREEAAEAFIEFYQGTLRQVEATLQEVELAARPSVFLDVRGGSLPDLSTAGDGSLGDFVRLAGGNNVGAALLDRPLGPVNIEYVLASNPDFYILTGASADGRPGLNMGADTDEATAVAALRKLAARDALRHLPAAESGNVYGIWHHFYVTPYHAVLVQVLAKWLHPEPFAQVDPQQTWRDMHERFLAIEPSGTFWVAGPQSRAKHTQAMP